ncbi:MAG: DUF2232 domain-containing protein [Clostridia bacterium]|nr:DUF2232 domain-containing protein [Clostridia bacterium]
MDGRIKKLGIASVCIIFVILFTVLSLFIPLGAMLFPLIATSLTAYVYIRCGKIASAINVVLTTGAMLLFTMDVESLLIVALSVIPGIVSGLMISKRKDYYSTLFGVSIAFLVVFLGTLLMAGRGLEGGVGGIIDQSIGGLKEALLIAGNNEATAELEMALSVTGAYIKQMFPTFIILTSLVFAYLHSVLLRILAKRVSKIRYNYISLDEHHAPRHVAVAYFIISIFALFLSGESKIGVAVYNIVAIIDFVLAFCGFSFIESKFKNKIKFGFLRAIIYIAVFLVASSFAIQLLSIIGMLDSFMNYRRIERNGE